MRNETRVAYNAYTQQIAKINGVSDVGVYFDVKPSVQQTAERQMQEKSDFLQKINIVGVNQQKGQKIGIGVSGPIASRTDTDVKARKPRNMANLKGKDYECIQTDYDTALKYATIDAWEGLPNFQPLLRDAILKRQALDCITVGFNGVKAAATTDISTYPLLQDLNIGWLQHIRDDAATQWKKDHNEIGTDYESLDGLVYDLAETLIKPWYLDDTGLVAIVGRKLMHDKLFPIVDKQSAPTEKLASDLIVSQVRLGGLQAVRVPYFPTNAVLVTRLDNLSIYYQKSARRRFIKEAPEFNQIENYEQSNDVFIVEDYDCAALAENITFKP